MPTNRRKKKVAEAFARAKSGVHVHFVIDPSSSVWDEGDESDYFVCDPEWLEESRRRMREVPNLAEYRDTPPAGSDADAVDTNDDGTLADVIVLRPRPADSAPADDLDPATPSHDD